MKADRNILFMALFIAFFAVGLSTAAQTKSSFEAGDFTGWNAQGSGWAVYSKAASEGKKSAMCSVAKNEQPNVKACAKVISKADPGFIVKVDLDVAGKAKHKSSTVKISVICVDAGGSILQEVEKKITTPSADFKRISVPELIVPSGTAETYLMMMVEVTKKAKSAEWWRFDNVVIQVK